MTPKRRVINLSWFFFDCSSESIKKKKTVRKLAKFARGEDLRTKPSYEGARSLLTMLTCLCSITSNLTAQKSH